VNVDILILQDVDLNARRTHRLNIAETIARKLEMNYVFGREFEELASDRVKIHSRNRGTIHVYFPFHRSRRLRRLRFAIHSQGGTLAIHLLTISASDARGRRPFQ